MNKEHQEVGFWDGRYLAGDTPWETARVPSQLARWLQAYPNGGAVLIPGCGSARELSAFTRAGWNVTGIDFSPAAIARAVAQAPVAKAKLILNDFFTHPFAAGEFDLIYERTFLTALSPARWPAVAARYRELLKPGGRIAGYCYYGHEDDPPPFLQPPDAPSVFTAGFALEEDAGSEDPLPFFGERERWQVWVRL